MNLITDRNRGRISRVYDRDPLRRLAVVGSYLPRRCGIATFTFDMVSGLAGGAPDAGVMAVALNDRPGGYRYPPEVKFEVEQQRIEDYRLAAEFLNMSRVGVVCVQHEFGIFGGREGEYILKIIDEVRMPVVTTLHTILKEPNEDQKQVICGLAEASDRLIAMSETGRGFLRETYGISDGKIELIPHGVPDTPFVDPNFYKEEYGVEGKEVIFTFGLLSENKGIETVIRALPQIVSKHPDVVYILLGTTHPNVKKREGERYREGLQELARSLGVEENVIFENRFAELSELCGFLGMADVYATPYLDERQIVSGSLSYAMSAGKATVSTPYWYAKEVLAEGRGRIVPFNDPDAFAREVIDLLDNDVARHAIRRRAYTFTRAAVWKEVAKSYLELFRQVWRERQQAPRSPFPSASVPEEDAQLLAEPIEGEGRIPLPEICLDHLCRLTDDVGILQHATYTVPNRDHGYCADDNARALMVTTLAGRHVPAGDKRQLADLSNRYLSFLQHAFNHDTGTFRNFLGYNRRWLEREGSSDSHGRSIWALGVAVRTDEDKNLRSVAATLLREALPATEGMTDVRAISFTLLGLDAYLSHFSGDSSVKRAQTKLATRLMSLFEKNATRDWPWPEHALTYANARLPQALLATGQSLARDDMVRMALRALEWLSKVQTSSGRFVPVGNRGWYPRGATKARFDQQPIEADSATAAGVQAFRITGEKSWLDEAVRCFQWFLGRNDLGMPLFDHATGGCWDGLEPTTVNRNQGAESTLCWLHALIQLHELRSQGILRGTDTWTTYQPDSMAPISS